MSKLLIEKVDNGYVVKISYPKDKRTTVVSMENKTTILDVVKNYLDSE
jgi:hypothetical protein